MIQARTEDNKYDPDDLMKIMVGWMTLDELQGTKTGRYFIDISKMKEMEQIT